MAAVRSRFAAACDLIAANLAWSSKTQTGTYTIDGVGIRTASHFVFLVFVSGLVVCVFYEANGYIVG